MSFNYVSEGIDKIESMDTAKRVVPPTPFV